MLFKAKLTGANLTSANLTNTSLTRAKLIRANLTNADFSRANIEKADFLGAILDGTRIEYAINKHTAKNLIIPIPIPIIEVPDLAASEDIYPDDKVLESTHTYTEFLDALSDSGRSEGQRGIAYEIHDKSKNIKDWPLALRILGESVQYNPPTTREVARNNMTALLLKNLKRGDDKFKAHRYLKQMIQHAVSDANQGLCSIGEMEEMPEYREMLEFYKPLCPANSSCNVYDLMQVIYEFMIRMPKQVQITWTENYMTDFLEGYNPRGVEEYISGMNVTCAMGNREKFLLHLRTALLLNLKDKPNLKRKRSEEAGPGPIDVDAFTTRAKNLIMNNYLPKFYEELNADVEEMSDNNKKNWLEEQRDKFKKYVMENPERKNNIFAGFGDVHNEELNQALEELFESLKPVITETFSIGGGRRRKRSKKHTRRRRNVQKTTIRKTKGKLKVNKRSHRKVNKGAYKLSEKYVYKNKTRNNKKH